MPGYQGHTAGGIATFALTVWALSVVDPTLRISLYVLPFCLSLTIMGALFPDIDIHSKGQKILYRFLAFAIPIAALLNLWWVLTGLLMLSVFPYIVKHRGITHNLWVILSIPAVPYFAHVGPYHKIIMLCTIFFTAGALSHIVLDFGVAKLITRSFKLKPKKRIRASRK